MTGPVLDLYAGPGGWDEGMRTLGITDVVGLEYEPNACATARAAGHHRDQVDIAVTPTSSYTGTVGLIASPPCQAWSMAGNRQGEHDRARVHALIDTYAAGSDYIGGDWADPRSHHAAQPIRWIRDLRPEWVCMEQVPAVASLWAHTARILRGWGYRTWTGELNAADYGVPQTRRRAILMASRTRPVSPPPATHAKDPGPADLFGAQLLPWVSMADALGWGMTERPYFVLASSRTTGGPDKEKVGGSAARAALYAERDAGRWALQVNGSLTNATVRNLNETAPTIALGNNSARCEWVPTTSANRVDEARRDESIRITVEEAAVLQSFPADYPWRGSKTVQFQQVGNAVPPRLAAAIVGAVTT